MNQYNVGCSICLDNFDNKRPTCSIRCGHIFHTKCVKKWLKKNKSCPVCRADSLDAKIRPTFFTVNVTENRREIKQTTDDTYDASAEMNQPKFHTNREICYRNPIPLMPQVQRQNIQGSMLPYTQNVAVTYGPSSSNRTPFTGVIQPALTQNSQQQTLGVRNIVINNPIVAAPLVTFPPTFSPTDDFPGLSGPAFFQQLRDQQQNIDNLWKDNINVWTQNINQLSQIANQLPQPQFQYQLPNVISQQNPTTGTPNYQN